MALTQIVAIYLHYQAGKYHTEQIILMFNHIISMLAIKPSQGHRHDNLSSAIKAKGRTRVSGDIVKVRVRQFHATGALNLR